MQITRAVSKHQQNRIRTYRDNSDSFSFFNLLTSDDLLDKVEELLPEHRERLYPPTEALSMFLAQAMSADRSCQNVVNQTALHRLSGGLMLLEMLITECLQYFKRRDNSPAIGELY